MPGQRGRKKGQVSEPKAFIEDPAIKPFKIRIGEESYDVIKGDALQPEAYYIELGNALKYIARQKSSKNKIFSITEYLKELKENQTLIAAAIEKVMV